MLEWFSTTRQLPPNPNVIVCMVYHNQIQSAVQLPQSGQVLNVLVGLETLRQIEPTQPSSETNNSTIFQICVFKCMCVCKASQMRTVQS